MKQVAGSIKLDLAQYREMAAFSQFASDLDTATQKLLAKGARLTELLKQKQNNPLPVEEEVVSIFSGVRGYLETVAQKDVTRFEGELLSRIKEEAPEILEAIRREKKLSEETEAKLKAFLEDFVQGFDSNS